MRRGQEYQLPDRQVLTSAVGRITAYMRSSIGILIFALVLAALSAVLTIVGPDQVGKIATRMADGLTTGIDLAAVAKIGIGLAILYVISALFGFFQHYIMATVTLKMSYRMRGDLSAKINRVPQKYFNTHAQGDILSRITNDVSTLQQGLTNSLPTIISAATQFLGCLAMMFVTQWRLALVALAITLCGLLLLVLIMKRSQPYFTARQESLGALNGYVEEMYTGHAVVRSSRATAQVGAQFDKLNAAVYDANWRSQFLSGVMQPLMNIIGNLSYVAVCIYGSILAINGTIAFGVIVSFILYVRLLSSPLTQIACRLRPPNLRLPGERGAVRRGRQDRHPHPDNRRGAVLPRALCLSGHAGEADHPRFLRRRAAGAEGRHRRADRRRENNDGQSADALFRSHRRPDHHRRHPHHRPAARECPRPVQHGPAGYLAL